MRTIILVVMLATAAALRCSVDALSRRSVIAGAGSALFAAVAPAVAE